MRPFFPAEARKVAFVTEATDDARKAEARRRLRAALDGVELLPEMTSDDLLIRASSQDQDQRDAEFVQNKPPHHGS